MPTARQQKTSEKLRIFSERFKAALERSNFHFQDNEIAEKVGVEPSAISNWRQGRNMAKGKNLRRLAEVLNCRTGWLLGGKEDEAADVLHRGHTPHGKDTWQQRALAAEKKLAQLRNGLWKLLETNDGLPPPQETLGASSLAAPGATGPETVRARG